MEMINKKKMMDQKALVAIRSDYEILRADFLISIFDTYRICFYTQNSVKLTSKIIYSDSKLTSLVNFIVPALNDDADAGQDKQDLIGIPVLEEIVRLEPIVTEPSPTYSQTSDKLGKG